MHEGFCYPGKSYVHRPFEIVTRIKECTNKPVVQDGFCYPAKSYVPRPVEIDTDTLVIAFLFFLGSPPCVHRFWVSKTNNASFYHVSDDGTLVIAFLFLESHAFTGLRKPIMQVFFNLVVPLWSLSPAKKFEALLVMMCNLVFSARPPSNQTSLSFFF